MTRPLDVLRCRRQFPALTREVNGWPAAFFDGPAGSQVPRRVINAVSDYLARRNANHGGPFATSVESDAMLDEAHRAAADFLGSPDADLVHFGPNMTTLTFALGRAIARTWKPGDEVLVCRTEHDANYTTWARAAEDAGATLKRVEMCPGDCTLDLEDLEKKLTDRTRLLAVSCASNAVGTVHPVSRITEMVHAVGGLVFLDAVHYAPHRTIDVVDWDCDFLACSAYKFFGPHIGLLYGKREPLETLPAYNLRASPAELPGRWMTGTQNHEGIAGMLSAIDYIASLGGDGDDGRRGALVRAYESIVAHEHGILVRLLRDLADVPGVRVLGVTDESRLDERVPTVSFTHERYAPDHVARHLAGRGVFVWPGNFYALPLSEALGLEPEGMVRAGILHYNTEEEVDRLVAALMKLD